MVEDLTTMTHGLSLRLRFLGEDVDPSRKSRSVDALIKQFVCGLEGANPSTISGEDDREATPVPIPNTEVKLSCADNIRLETAREDRFRRI